MSQSDTTSQWKAKLSPAVLKDIEGLDPAEFGFGRKECCGGVPEKLPGSMTVTEHVFLGTSMRAAEWSPRVENVEGHTAIRKLLKKHKCDADYHVCEMPDATDDCLLHIHAESSGEVEKTSIIQYSLPADPTAAALPWDPEAKGVIAVNRSNEYFIFVCAHLTRDKRCGYCGLVLVDLLRSAAHSMATAECPPITVLPCSHVGGHIYAGNVLVYSKFGGVCFGLFTPEDVEVLIQSLLEDQGKVPASLSSRIRGCMGKTYAAV